MQPAVGEPTPSPQVAVPIPSPQVAVPIPSPQVAVPIPSSIPTGRVGNVLVPSRTDPVVPLPHFSVPLGPSIPNDLWLVRYEVLDSTVEIASNGYEILKWRPSFTNGSQSAQNWELLPNGAGMVSYRPNGTKPGIYIPPGALLGTGERQRLSLIHRAVFVVVTMHSRTDTMLIGGGDVLSGY